MRIAHFNKWQQDMLLLAVMLLLATLFNPNWAFSPLQILSTFGAYNDHWLYLGFMLDLTDKLGYFSETYFRHYSFERFSFILPGATLYQLFTPIVANYLLKFMVYLGAIYGLYWALHNVFGRKTALVTALAMGCYSWFLRSAGWDYVDGAGIAYFLLTFGAMVGAIYAQRKTTWRGLCVLTGMMACNLVATNVYLVLFLPHLLGIALWLNHRQHRRPIVQSLLLAVIGIGVVTAIYGAVSYVMSGVWFFLSVSVASSNIISSSHPLYQLVETLYTPMYPHYHIVPIVLLLTGVIWSFTRTRTAYFGIQRLLLLQLLWFYMILILSHYIILPYLIVFLYSSYLIPVAFLWLGGVVAPTLESVSQRQFNHMLIAICGVFLAPFVLSVLFPITESWQNDTLLLMIGLIGMGIGLLFIHYRTVLLFFVAFSLFSWMSSSQIYVFTADRLRNQETFAIAIDAYEQIQAHYVRNGIRDIEYVLEGNAIIKIPAFVISSLSFDGHYLRGNYTVSETENSINTSQSMFRRLSLGQDTQKTVLITRYPHTPEWLIYQSAIEDRLLLYQLEKTISIQRYDMTLYLSFINIHPNPIAPFVVEFARGEEINFFEMTGFGGLELADGRTYRWTNEPTARITYQLEADAFDPSKTYQVQLLVMAYLEEAVRDSLSLTINGERLALIRTPYNADSLFIAQIDGAILAGDVLELVFETDGISRPADFGYPDPRTLGVAFDWLIIHPLSTDE